MVDLQDGLVERARRGDADAFREILQAFEKPVFQTVWRLVGGRFPNDIEDIAQDIFLKVFRNLDRFDPARGVKFSTWVYTFVKNHCFDVLKKRRLATVALDPRSDDARSPAALQLEGAAPQPGDSVVRSELDLRIGEAVARLPDDQRVAFVLREYQGLDYREIAAIAGCSAGTVKSRIHRAKEALRNSLKKYVLQ